MKRTGKIAAVTSIVVLATSVCACGTTEEGTQIIESMVKAETQNKAETNTKIQEKETRNEKTFNKGNENKEASHKEETVYVNAKADGSAYQVIVSEWLQNTDKAGRLTDKSNLSNIDNVKGSETFRKNADGTLVWDSKGSDIYYQGESKEELPVSMKITYFLNGKEMSAEEMAGKSGQVKMRIDYYNHTSQDVAIGGKTETICTPFLMTTGMILPTDTFTNVEVVNGKVISDGNKQIVVAMAFPGLKESLQLEKSDLLKEKKIPDYVEITADAKNFSLAMTATMATTGTLSELGLDNVNSMEDLSDSLDKLADASASLVEGSSELFAGTGSLKEAFVTFSTGLSDADSGVSELKEGIDMLDGKKGELLSGVNALTSGISTLESGAKELKSGIDEYTGGVGTVSDGVAVVNTGAKDLNTNLKAMKNGVEEYAAGVEGLEQGIAALKMQVDSAMGTASQVSRETKVSVAVPKPAVTVTGKDAVNEVVADLQSQLTALQETMESLQGAVKDLESPEVTVSTNISSEKSRVCGEIAGMDGLSEEQISEIQNVINSIHVVAETNVTAPSVPSFSGVSEQIGALQTKAAEIQTACNNISANVEMPETVEQAVSLGTAPDVGVLLQTVSAALGQLQAGAQQLTSQNSVLTEGMKGLSSGAEKLQGGTTQLQSGTAQLQSNSKKLKDGAAQLQNGSGELLTGSRQLSSGAGSLSEGIGRLAEGASSLKAGTTKLVEGSNELSGGISDLNAGAEKLSSGMTEFDKDGINPLTTTVEDDFTILLERLKATVDADKNYQSFGERTDNTKGSVKFIIETGAIGK